MEKKAEFERQGKMGNRSQDSLSKEVFPIWKVCITLDYPCHVYDSQISPLCLINMYSVQNTCRAALLYSSDLLSFESYVFLCTSSGKQREPDVDETIYRAVPGYSSSCCIDPTPTWWSTRSGGSRGMAGMASSSTPWAAAWQTWRCRFLKAGRSPR